MTDARPPQTATDARLLERIGRLAGQPAVAIEPVQGGGYSLARRLAITFTDGSTAFAKVATNRSTAQNLRAEADIYGSITGPFMPAFVGFDPGSGSDDGDDGEPPILIVEDLRHGHWPPPWTGAQVDLVCKAMAQVHACDASDIAEVDLHGPLMGWREVAANPKPFLSLRLATDAWLERALPELSAAAEALDTSGDALIHMDVRSDNLCLLPDRAVLVDWNWAARGSARLDIACWLPSLHAEGGPTPETVLPDAPHEAAALAGYFAAKAGLPPPKTAPRVREVQSQQLSTSLPWAIRELGLPPLDGPAATRS